MSPSVRIACYLSGSLFILGYLTGCSPVRGGAVSKSGYSSLLTSGIGALSPEETSHVLEEVQVDSRTHVTTETESFKQKERLPDEVETSLLVLDKQQVDDIKEKGRTQVEIKNNFKKIEIHSLVEVDVAPRTADREKMKKFALQWKVVDLQNFEVSVDGGLDHADINEYVLKNLSHLSVGYREIK